MSAPILPCSGTDQGLRIQTDGGRTAAPLEADADDLRSSLASLIEAEIIPRLLLINHEVRADQEVCTAFTAAEIAEFSGMALSANMDELFRFVRGLRERGHSLESLFVRLLTPTAHFLGELWNEDRCDFLEVTTAVSKLQGLMALLRSGATEPQADTRQRALLLALAGEQHLLGLDITAELLRSSGWHVVVEKGGGIERQTTLVKGEWFGICGITLSTPSGFADVGRTIAAMRHASRNRDLHVMVGGRAFAGRRDLATEVGADGVAEDAPSAIALASRLVGQQAHGASGSTPSSPAMR